MALPIDFRNSPANRLLSRMTGKYLPTEEDDRDPMFDFKNSPAAATLRYLKSKLANSQSNINISGDAGTSADTISDVVEKSTTVGKNPTTKNTTSVSNDVNAQLLRDIKTTAIEQLDITKKINLNVSNILEQSIKSFKAYELAADKADDPKSVPVMGLKRSSKSPIAGVNATSAGGGGFGLGSLFAAAGASATAANWLKKDKENKEKTANTIANKKPPPKSPTRSPRVRGGKGALVAGALSLIAGFLGLSSVFADEESTEQDKPTGDTTAGDVAMDVLGTAGTGAMVGLTMGPIGAVGGAAIGAGAAAYKYIAPVVSKKLSSIKGIRGEFNEQQFSETDPTAYKQYKTFEKQETTKIYEKLVKDRKRNTGMEASENFKKHAMEKATATAKEKAQNKFKKEIKAASTGIAPKKNASQFPPQINPADTSNQIMYNTTNAIDTTSPAVNNVTNFNNTEFAGSAMARDKTNAIHSITGAKAPEKKETTPVQINKGGDTINNTSVVNNYTIKENFTDALSGQ